MIWIGRCIKQGASHTSQLCDSAGRWWPRKLNIWRIPILRERSVCQTFSYLWLSSAIVISKIIQNMQHTHTKKKQITRFAWHHILHQTDWEIYNIILPVCMHWQCWSMVELCSSALSEKAQGSRKKKLANCKTRWGSHFVMFCSAFMFLKDNLHLHTTPHTCLKYVFICFQYRQHLSWMLSRLQKGSTYLQAWSPSSPFSNFIGFSASHTSKWNHFICNWHYLIINYMWI